MAGGQLSRTGFDDMGLGGGGVLVFTGACAVRITRHRGSARVPA